MKIKEIKGNYTLKNEDIDIISRQSAEFMDQLEMDNKEILRIRLTIEETLLRYQEELGAAVHCGVHMGKRLGRPFISLNVKGNEFNPFEETDEEFEEDFGYYSGHLLGKLGVAPLYSRERGANHVFFKLKKPKMNPLLQLFIAIAAALAVGFAGLHMPEQILLPVTESFVTPVCNKFFDILGTLAGPITFLSITWGIYGIGDATVFGKIGKKMIAHFISMLFITGAVMCLLALPIFNLNFSAHADGSSQIPALINLLLDFFPKDIFSPFIDGNFLQIVLMAIVKGISLLVLNRQTSVIASAIEQLNNLIQYIMEFVGSIIPVFVFVLLVQMIWSGTFDVAARAVKAVAGVLGVTAAVALLLVLIISIVMKVNPMELIKKTMPAFMIALSTASSAAAFTTCIRSCEKDLGIDTRIPKFGVPIGISMYPPGSVASYLIIAMYMAEVYNVECSFVWLIILVFTSVVLTIATPPIPGGAVACYAILFLQLGIPEAALGVALALDTLMDFAITGLNILCLQLELVLQARGMKLIDRDALRKKLTS